MTTKKERNILYSELEKLNDNVIMYQTHTSYLMNVLNRLKKDLNDMVEQIDGMRINRDALVKVSETWFEGLDALMLCSDDIKSTLAIQKKITEILSIDTEFLKKTYEFFGEDKDGQSKT